MSEGYLPDLFLWVQSIIFDHERLERDDAELTPEAAALSRLIMTVFLLNGRLFRRGDSFVRDLGLSGVRWQVMAAVSEQGRTVADIARHYESARQGILRVVTEMVKDGLLELVDNPGHRRSKLVRFTDHGARVFEEVERRRIGHLNELGDHYSREELGASAELIERLQRAFG